MVCYAIKWYAMRFEQNTPPYTEEFQRFDVKWKEAKVTTYLQRERLFIKIKVFNVVHVCYVMVCYGMIWRKRIFNIVYYGMRFHSITIGGGLGLDLWSLEGDFFFNRLHQSKYGCDN